MSSVAEDGDLVSRVAEITGVAASEAHHLLEACANDVEAAIALFFEQGGDSASAPQPSVVLNDVDEDNVRAPIAPVMEQLIGPDDDNYYAAGGQRRARLAQRVKVCPLRDFAREGALMEQQLQQVDGHGLDGTAAPLFAALDPNGRSQQRRARAAAMVYSAQTTEPTIKQSRLGDLFRPPTDISYAGPFQVARKRAAELTHWLLVNVQSDNFESQVLNRDVWSNKEVRKLIRHHFVLWQVESDSVEGRRFVTFYHCAKLPYVCVIDPRTGEEVWKSAHPKEATLLKDLKKFLKEHKDFSRNLCDDTPSTSTKRRATISISDDDDDNDNGGVDDDGGTGAALTDHTSKSNGSAGVGASIKRSKLLELSEEEQIALAIRNSVRESRDANGKPKADSSSSSSASNARTCNADENFDFAALDDEASSDFGSVEEFGENETKAPCERTSYVEQLGKDNNQLTTIKLRLLNAAGVDEVTQLRWPSDTPLKVIRLYLAECHQHLPKSGYKLICAFPRKTLEPQHDAITLKEYGLHPSANLHLTLDD